MHLVIDKKIKESLTLQIFNQIKKMILDGTLPGGFKLLSTRDISHDYGVSRNVVIEAYEQLLVEGYIESFTGDGSYVKKGLIFKNIDSPKIPRLIHGGILPQDRSVIDFKTGLPCLDLFPMNKWLKITKEVYQNITPRDLEYGTPSGTIDLREAIANYVRIYRGVNCSPNQILITGGTTQAIGIISKLLISKEKQNVILEDPITKDISKIVKSYNGHVIPIPVDSNGIITDELNDGMNPNFIYTAPSHNYPLGMTMSIERRIKLLNYSRKNSCYIVEDDYDSEFRYDVMPTPSLQGLDPNKVIYIGTFSKTLFPALRIGYLILPPQLINGCRRQKWLHDLHNSTLDQLVLAQFINDGHYAKLITKLKKVYKAKRNHLTKTLKEVFKENIEIIGNKVGMHVAVKFNNITFTDKLISKLFKNGVKIYSVEEHTITKGVYNDTIILGYGNLTKEDISKGIVLIKQIIDTAGLIY